MAAEDYFNFDDFEDGLGYGRGGFYPSPRKSTRMGTLVAPTLFETDKAWKVRVGKDEMWLPKSQCSRKEEGLGGDTYSIPEWLVTKIGIDLFVDFN